MDIPSCHGGLAAVAGCTGRPLRRGAGTPPADLVPPLTRLLIAFLLPLALLACKDKGDLAWQATALRTEAMVAPLPNKDPKRPVFVLADKVWPEEEIRILPRELTGTPGHLPRSSHRLPLGSFRYDGADGPVTLVVDYAGYLVDPSRNADAAVKIGIECPRSAQGCAYPLTKSVLPFQAAFMARQEVSTAAGKRTVVVGRESHSYVFAPDSLVQMDLTLLEPSNLQPLELKARVIFGEYDRRALPGQTTRQQLVWRIGAAALGVLALAYWWLFVRR